MCARPLCPGRVPNCSWRDNSVAMTCWLIPHFIQTCMLLDDEDKSHSISQVVAVSLLLTLAGW